MAGEEVIGKLLVQLGVDASQLSPDMQRALTKAQQELAKGNQKISRATVSAHDSVIRQLNAITDKISGRKATSELNMIAQAVERMGGTAGLSGQQLDRLRVQVNALAAAGAKVPASLANITGGKSKLGAAFTSLTSGGGVSGALAALGPAGVAAAAGIGAVTAAGTAAARQMGELVDQAEQWSNISKSTGLGTQTVQRLSILLGEAQIPADALTRGMKQLSKEIAGGGKGLAEFGISIEGWDILSQEERLQAVARVIAGIEDPATKSAVATAALGRSGADLIPVMDDVASGAYKMIEALGAEQLKTLADADKALDDAGRTWTSWKNTALASMAEVFNALTKRRVIGGGQASIDAPETLTFEQLRNVGNPDKFLDRSGLTLGPEEEETRKKSKKATDDTSAAEKKLTEERAKAAARATEIAVSAASDSMRLRQDLTQSALAGISAATPAAGGGPGSLGSPAAAAQAMYQSAIKMAQGAQASGQGLDQIRHKLEGMGLSSDEATDLMDAHLKKQEEVNQSTVDWTGRLADLAETMHGLGGVLGAVGAAAVSVVGSLSLVKKMGTGADGKFSLGNLGASMKSFEGKMAVGGAAAGALGSLGQMAGGGNTVAGSALGGAAAGAQMGAIAGPWGMAAGAVIGGAIGFFKGSKLKKEAKEAGTIMGKSVSVEQLKALKEEAKAAGKDWKVYLKEMKKQEDQAKAIEKRQKLEGGLSQAAQFAQQLQDRIAAGGFSDKMKAAADTMIGKVRDALLKSGMGSHLDEALGKSEAFQGAQGAAGDIAGIMSGMRQAGMIDSGLTEAAAASSQELFNQARAAALEAGKSPEEAQKAGFGAISQLLREQLNASVQSGKELDANTKRLLEEAKANGIEILADPAIETLDVAKQQLDELKKISKTRPTGAAQGIGPMMTRDLGGGLGPLIQTHPGELVWVLPKALAKGGIISAARGIGSVDDDERRGGGGGGGSSSGSGASGDGTSGGSSDYGGAAPSLDAIVAAVSASVTAAVRNRPEVNLQVTQQLTESPFASAESKSEARAFTLDAAADALAANSGRFAQEIDRRINARMAGLR